MRPENRETLQFILGVVVLVLLTSWVVGALASLPPSRPCSPLLRYCPPVVTLGYPVVFASEIRVDVTEVAANAVPVGASDFQVNLYLNGGALGMTTSIPTAGNFTVAPAPGGWPFPTAVKSYPVTFEYGFEISWTDTHRNGKLGVGNYFTITRAAGLVSGSYEFQLYYDYTSIVATAAFQIA